MSMFLLLTNRKNNLPVVLRKFIINLNIFDLSDN